MPKNCGEECSCPSRLYHTVDYIVRRYNAPIPPPSLSWVIGELEAALEEAKEEAIWDEDDAQRYRELAD